jgi:predicted HNH restriction endonuclease
MSSTSAPRDLTNRKERTNFRLTVAWKQFRETFVVRENGCCELCGTKYYGKQKKSLQLHHLDPAHYDDLNPLKFKLLCSGCHDLVERFAMKLKGSKKDEIKNKAKWIDLLRECLPYDVILDDEVPHES